MAETFEITPNERALSQTRAARRAAAEQGGKHLSEALTALNDVRNLEVKAVNALRSAGQSFNVCAGREQLLFTVDGKDFCRREILPFLPPGIDVRHVRLAVHLANTLPEPIESPEQLGAVKRELQQMLELFGVEDSTAGRPALQTEHARNYFAELADRAASMRLLFDKVEATEPMEKWPAAKLDEFLEYVQPMKDRITRAERIRLGLALP